ncbi:hypothetical protein E5S67_01878 [Microcoleus sp. IPMA8]|uniref:Uncharacterized protein n=1 Tax=Microcoleus asticus IPMA8 TaxID=2563858 RepID=A0ABX2CX59_9CYAN|nr:hypothetical protein [Microcoleus asticus IPMA8]
MTIVISTSREHFWANRSDRSTLSNQSDFSFLQINPSYCGAVLNAIKLLDRCQSAGLAKEKRGIIASKNPLLALIPPAGEIAS